MNKVLDIILYGGAFDPPHQGHKDCLRLVLELFQDASVWVAPGVKPAGQAGNHKDPVESYEERMKLCYLAFSDLDDGERILYSDVESMMPQPNYTFKTISEIKKLNLDKKIGLLIGEDQLEGFFKWKNPIEILEIASLVIVKRNYISKSEIQLKDLADKSFNKMGLTISWNKNKDCGRFNEIESGIFIIDENICAAESSLIKKKLEKRQCLPEGWLPSEVLKYIRDKQIYSCKGK